MEVDFLTYRMYERFIMTGIIFFVGICMIFYMLWKKPWQNVEASNMWLAATFQVSNPLLVLGVLVAYSWASLSNPVVRERPETVTAVPPGVFANAGESSRTESAIGGQSEALMAVFQHLYVARSVEKNAQTLSLSDSADILDLALKYEALETAGVTPENLLVNNASYAKIKQGIEDGYAALDR